MLRRPYVSSSIADRSNDQDTLDLQDHDAPSAQDHTKQPEHPNPLGSGRPAPHQEISLRHAEQESKSEVLTASTLTNDGDHLRSVDILVEQEAGDDSLRRNGEYNHDEDGDLADEEQDDDLLDDDMMDKLSSSPSIDDEDIDFEFVYALHNFIATVDGQANAAKGDTMVLLDDSNSYWWLVRVVKDGSIGYLPAEHIETPTERLARLNKHRNVDLSATMLGDNSEKSKNPLKKAMRRRNAKTVNFAPPTYIEASDVEYSTEEEDEHGDFFNDDETVESEDGDVQEQNEDIVVEPLRTRPQKERSLDAADGGLSPVKHEPDRAGSEARRSSEDFFDSEEPSVSRSRNGTVRNTDSFFKDDTAEPKKISLTPNLLRDESSGTTLTGEWKETGRGSFEMIDKSNASQDKMKDEKKRKDKKPGMLSGLFKRKDKKHKSSEDDIEEAERSPADSGSLISPQPKTSLDAISPEPRATKSPRQVNTKLQKQTPSALSPTSRPEAQTNFGNQESLKEREVSGGSQTNRSIRRVVSDDAGSHGDAPGTAPTTDNQRRPSKDSFTNSLESQNHQASPVDRPSSEAQWREPYENIGRHQPSVMSPPQRFAPNMGSDYSSPISPTYDSFSPVEEIHSPVTSPPDDDHPAVAQSPSLNFSVSSSPEVGLDERKSGEDTRISLDTRSMSTPTWSDASLRSYLDEENDIRDLFIIVHDSSNIPPAGPDHPVTGRLFKEESKRLREMNNQLDEMLVKWMSQRRMSSGLSRSLRSSAS
ncbi:hypothetical protein N7539_002664 [Penicillium diatomitis]|uniref:SH3 domain-containing protein n=1 Tax=Penicillium diatomitis TaxID=2819901 RepID=A0A9X0BZF1_9EURO|nr:uncharacterized protein N7539_002664 [Penicillium diatomitis]KAJ5491097.1 hypothetical protein N7539_002664 [Penicillium diatomitis]